MLLTILLHVSQPAQQPDIELRARVTASRVVVENRGETSLVVRTSTNGHEGEGNVVNVEAPDLPQGRRELNNVEVRVRAEARIPAPANEAEQLQEPPKPQ